MCLTADKNASMRKKQSTNLYTSNFLHHSVASNNTDKKLST